MTSEQRTPRVYIEIFGGNIQAIAVDGEVEIVDVDYDNAEDAGFDADSVEVMLAENLHSGTTDEYESHIATARAALEEIASRNADDPTP